MAIRKRLGIRFDIPYATATGAVIYFLNIINALKDVPDEHKPEIYAFVSTDGPVDHLKKIDYPYLKILPIKYLPKWVRAINRIYRKVINGKKFNLFHATTYTGEPLDGVLSLVIPSEDINTRRQLLWIADLQVYHLPENYTVKEIARKHNLLKKIIKAKHDIVLCSQWCINDFYSIFPGSTSRMHKLSFTTSHPDLSYIDMEILKEKYSIKNAYFIVSNQFWIHKNHLCVLKAINSLKKKYPNLLCIITGNQKVASAKSKGYMQALMDYIKEHNLSDNIQFLGLIPREEQLCLLKESLAIIQPSFFESWNTTVEDAKLLNKYIILSNLPVHREQISKNVFFFDPNNAVELAAGMEMVLNDEQPPIVPYNYNKDVESYAESILKMIK